MRAAHRRRKLPSLVCLVLIGTASGSDVWDISSSYDAYLHQSTPTPEPTLAPGAVSASYSYNSYDETPMPPPPRHPPPPTPPPPPPPAAITLCSNGCPRAPKFARDTFCDDGGPDSNFDKCELGTDCEDCGPRVRFAMVPASPKPPPPPPSPPPARQRAPRVSTNPFREVDYYIGQSQRMRLVRTINGTSGATRQGLLGAWTSPTAFWIDTKEKLRDASVSVRSILEEADAQNHQPVPNAPLCTFVLHLLPNRDCQKRTVGSPLCCHYRPGGQGCDYSVSGPCDVGVQEYQLDVVDELASLFEEFHTRVPIALVVEPGALEALALNQPRCSSMSTVHGYQRGIEYAVDEIANRAPTVALYLDAGNGGTLGWGSLVHELVAQVADLEVSQWIRGFATNVGSYHPLGVPCPLAQADLTVYCKDHAHAACCQDPCHQLAHFNQANNEHNYVQLIAHHMRMAFPGFSPHFVIDTGRNGVDHSRDDCSTTCNVRRAGLGRRPTAETGFDLVDGYFWVKPPGESDGCPPGSKCPHPDPACRTDGSVGTRAGEQAAPPAGDWYTLHMQLLAFSAVELPDQAALDAASQEYQALARPEDAGSALGSSSSLAEGLGAAVAVAVLILLMLGLCRRGLCRPGSQQRARPREWSTMLDDSALPDAPSEGSKAAEVVHIAMSELEPAEEGEGERFKAVD